MEGGHFREEGTTQVKARKSEIARCPKLQVFWNHAVPSDSVVWKMGPRRQAGSAHGLPYATLGNSRETV